MMNAFQAPRTSMALVAIAFGCALYFIAVDAGHYLYDFSASSYGPFWSKRGEMRLHAAAGSVALILGFVQISLALLGRTGGGMHRLAGRAYVASVVLGGGSALMLVARGSAIGPLFGAIL